MKERFDQVSVNIKVHSLLDEPPLDEWLIIFNGKEVDQLEVRDFVLDQFPKLRDQIVISDMRTKVSWGASAAVLEFIVQVGPGVGGALLTGVAGGAAWDAAKAIGSRITQLWANADDDDPVEPLSDEAACREAKRIVVRRYDTGTDALEIERTSTDFETGWTSVTLVAAEGTTYTVDLLRNGDGVRVARLTRTAHGL